MDVTATIALVTRNRRDELRRALCSALAQHRVAEVLIIDDGSTDATSEMVRGEFPNARLERRADSKGYIARRNEAGQLARGAVIFSIDDDAEFSSPYVVEQTLGLFSDDRIGAIAIPFIDVLKGQSIHQSAPAGAGCYITDSYVGTAHAVRRDLFLQLGGYREDLVHQGEERDFCLRMLDAGYVVRLGTGDPIHHYESIHRDLARMDYYGRRNDILFAWQNVPMPHLPAHLLGTTLNGLGFGLRCGRFTNHARGIIAGYMEILRGSNERRPVSAAAYRLQRQLRKSGPRRLEEIAEQLAILSGQETPLQPGPTG